MKYFARKKTAATQLLSLSVYLLLTFYGFGAEIHRAVKNGDIDKLRSILSQEKHSAANSRIQGGITPLHIAAAMNQTQAIKILLIHGADINARTQNGFTALHLASSRNYANAVEFLLEYGADPSIKSKNGITPLDLAEKKDAKSLIDVLSRYEEEKIPEPPRPLEKESTEPAEQVDWIDNSGVGGTIETRFYRDITRDNGEASKSLDAVLLFEDTIRFPEHNAIARVGVEMRHENFDLDSDENIESDISLEEAYLEKRWRAWTISAGKQTITWGKLDDIVVLDRISPQDLRWFVLYDKQERKNPIPMVSATWFGSPYQIEAVVIPYFQPSEMDYFGSGWALFGKLKQTVLSGNFPEQAKAVVNGVEIDESSVSDEPELALRFRGRVGEIDHTFNYMTIHNRVPTLKEKTRKGNITKQFLFYPNESTLSHLVASTPEPEDLTLEAGHDRMHIVGADFETVAGNYGLRGEIAHMHDLPFMKKDDLSYTKESMTSAGIGIDHTTDWDLYANLQFVVDYVSGADELWETEDLAFQLGFNASKNWMYGDFAIDLQAFARVPYNDWMLSPEATYKFRNGIETTLQILLLEGEQNTLFGRFDDKDLIMLKMRYPF